MIDDLYQKIVRFFLLAYVVLINTVYLHVHTPHYISTHWTELDITVRSRELFYQLLSFREQGGGAKLRSKLMPPVPPPGYATDFEGYYFVTTFGIQVSHFVHVAIWYLRGAWVHSCFAGGGVSCYWAYLLALYGYVAIPLRSIGVAFSNDEATSTM